MSAFDELKDKGENLAADHPDQAEKISDQAIDKGGDAADKITDDKYSSQIDSAQQKADDAVGS